MRARAWVLVFLVIGCGGGDGGGSASGTGGAGGQSTGGQSTGGQSTGGAGGQGAGGAGGTSAGGSSGGSCAEAPHTGEATYYAATGDGNCMFGPSPNDLMVGAMNQADYLASGSCGRCAAIQGPSGSVTVRIVDRCPECKPGDIDLSPQAFEKIAALPLGRVDISWTYVPCAVTGPLRYRFKEGSNQWWTAVQVRNHRHGIAKLEYEKGGSFVEVKREDYNYFVEPAGMGPGPYTFRVTDVYGHSVTDTGVAHAEASEVSGAAQLPDCP
ncbi:MAG: hypothetical protein DYH12_31580 [Sorangiineae bacterium PRO1]|nr:hypothetical protein [Sorangiineae bacterium PRO1]